MCSRALQLPEEPNECATQESYQQGGSSRPKASAPSRTAVGPLSTPISQQRSALTSEAGHFSRATLATQRVRQSRQTTAVGARRVSRQGPAYPTTRHRPREPRHSQCAIPGTPEPWLETRGPRTRTLVCHARQGHLTV